jgi:hypothetical protein
MAELQTVDRSGHRHRRLQHRLRAHGHPPDDVYNHDHGMLGPCPLHFSTFDPARSGMNVMGKSVEWLPQVVLNADDNGDTRATGMYGLIYGYPANLLKLDGGN